MKEQPFASRFFKIRLLDETQFMRLTASDDKFIKN